MSWVVNFFNSTHVQQFAPSEGSKRIERLHTKDYNDVRTESLQQGEQHELRQKSTEPMDEEEEAARSPYWHVSLSSFHTPIDQSISRTM